MTPEELDEARAEEAYRQWQEEGCQGDDTIDVAAIAARLARENWTPPEPEPVDPDLLAFREWAACRSEENCATAWASAYRQGRFDRKDDARAYLAGARMAREQERERAKVLVRGLEDISDADQDEISHMARAALAKYQGEA